MWQRLAKEKVHFFWTVPVINMILNITANLGVVYLVLKAGRWEALLAIPFVLVCWIALWLVGRKKLIRNEVDYNWRLSKSWVAHEQKTDDILKRLERLEAKK